MQAEKIRILGVCRFSISLLLAIVCKNTVLMLQVNVLFINWLRLCYLCQLLWLYRGRRVKHLTELVAVPNRGRLWLYLHVTRFKVGGMYSLFLFPKHRWVLLFKRLDELWWCNFFYFWQQTYKVSFGRQSHVCRSIALLRLSCGPEGTNLFFIWVY